MNNPYLSAQMFWTMSICMFIWIYKANELKFHVPLKLMGFVYPSVSFLFWERMEFDVQSFENCNLKVSELSFRMKQSIHFLHGLL